MSDDMRASWPPSQHHALDARPVSSRQAVQSEDLRASWPRFHMHPEDLRASWTGTLPHRDDRHAFPNSNVHAASFPTTSVPMEDPRSPKRSPQEETDLWWHFEQQRRFLTDLRASAVGREETVATDQHQAWNVKVISQQCDIERLQ